MSRNYYIQDVTVSGRAGSTEIIVSNKMHCFQNLSPEQADYCIKHMKPYIDPMSGRSIQGALDYEEFTRSLFQS